MAFHANLTNMKKTLNTLALVARLTGGFHPTYKAELTRQLK